MTRTDPHPPRLALRLQAFWARAMVSLLLALVGLALGWRLAESVHPRLVSASQTSPALPELRPVPGPQAGVHGLGDADEAQALRSLPRWPGLLPLLPTRPVPVPAELAIYGRMNLDGG